MSISFLRSDHAGWSHAVEPALYPQEDVGGEEDGDMAMWLKGDLLWT